MKIFGIGLPKTGTTSLYAALHGLGYRSATFGHLKEMRPDAWLDGDFSPDYLAELDAVTDTPIPTYYPQLDVRYPGSKFILTVRDPDAWLESCRRHFEPLDAGDGPDEYGRTTRLALWGVRRFSADRFRYVYRTHDLTARAYFEDRPGDLLALDLGTGEGWAELCGFLDKPIPDEPFPQVQPGWRPPA